MKNLTKSLAVSAFLLIPLFMNAQSPMDKIFEKYSGKFGFTTTVIFKEMLKVLIHEYYERNNMSGTSPIMWDQMQNMRSVNCNTDSLKAAQSLAFLRETWSLFPPPVYKEIRTFKDKKETTRFLTKSDMNGKIIELVVLHRGPHELAVINLTGKMNLADISLIAEALRPDWDENGTAGKESHKK